MKRLNPQTNQPFKRNDVREDGYIFYEYKTNRLKKSGYFQERWLSPERILKRKQEDIQRTKKYRKTPKGKIKRQIFLKTYTPKYYEKNRSKLLERSKKHYESNKEDILTGIKQKKQTVPGRAKALLSSAKKRAKVKTLEITLTKEWVIQSLETGKCALTGLAFDFSTRTDKNTNPMAPSIDRIDSTKGYTPDNCRVVLFCVNSALNSYGLEFMKPIFAILAGLKPPVDRL